MYLHVQFLTMHTTEMIRVLYFIPLLYGAYFCTHKLYILAQIRCGDQSVLLEKTSSDTIRLIKRQLQLEPHPSGGGGFKQVWKGDRTILFSDKTGHGGPRSTGTSIYFLRVAPTCVHWHKHLSDQAFFWHAGGALNIHMVSEDGRYKSEVLCDVTTNEKCSGQVIIPHDTWYAAELVEDAMFNLSSEVVMPGFEFQDWSDGEEEDIIRDYPQHKDIIKTLSLHNAC